MKGWKRYQGSANAICDAIIKDCWNGSYLQASAGHFCQFYARDIGIASNHLGDKEKLRATLSYALECFTKHGSVTTSITPKGQCFDFPMFAPDSLAFVLRALSSARACEIVKEHKAFLEDQISDWCTKTLAGDGFVKRNVHFSSMRDHAIRSSSCYDNIMVLLLKQEAAKLKLKTPSIMLTRARFVREFWTGTHFRDERDNNRVSGDANVVPFWLGVVNSKSKARKALSTLDSKGMTKPLPLAYNPPGQSPRMIAAEAFVPGWEREARWMQLGLMYAIVANSCDKALYDNARAAILARIETDQNVLEVFTPEGTPYRSMFYHADEGMLWGAALARKLL